MRMEIITVFISLILFELEALGRLLKSENTAIPQRAIEQVMVIWDLISIAQRAFTLILCLIHNNLLLIFIQT